MMLRKSCIIMMMITRRGEFASEVSINTGETTGGVKLSSEGTEPQKDDAESDYVNIHPM